MSVENTYSQVLDYLYNSLPVFERSGANAYKPGLHNIEELLFNIGNPHKKFKSIHVAGTNGKGSSSHMLAAILQSAGYKTGLFISPHLKDYTERIRVNGIPASKEFVIDFVERNRKNFEHIHPSFFEMSTAMAFEYFAKEEVDIAVIEVGLGGRLDSTNVITPEVSLITNISFDHMQYLGNTLASIAAEKAGIIKQDIPVVISETQSETIEVFQHKAEEKNSSIYFADQIYSIEGKGFRDGKMICKVSKERSKLWAELECELSGIYQLKNLAGVLAVTDVLSDTFRITREAVENGLRNVSSFTGLKGRWQQLQASPLVIADTGHNAAGLEQIVSQLKSINYKQLYIIFGTSSDKDIRAILSLLPPKAHYIFCEAHTPRACKAEELLHIAQETGLSCEIIKDVNEAYKSALSKASEKDMIFIGGSNFVVAELNNL